MRFDNFVRFFSGKSPVGSVEKFDCAETEYLDQMQYFDGLGRPNATVMCKITPDQQDLVSFLEYDNFGREFKQWLPAKIDQNNGNFVDFETNFIQAATSFYNGDQRPFVENVLESSPLNRFLGQKGAGADWEQHPIQVQYLANEANEVPWFEVVNNQLKRNKSYSANTLYKTVSIDEDGKTAAEYKDKLGRVVMTSQANDHKTCYVYDDFGNLRYVLPPLATDAITGIVPLADDNSTLADYAYIYKYDNRNRQISKKLPGCEPIYMVYDKADRLVFSQDGNQRTSKKWTYFRYDIFGRILYTGICSTNTSHANLQDNFKDIIVTETRTNTGFGYAQTAYSGINYNELLIVNYYDNYNFLNLLDNDIKDALTYTENPDYDKPYSSSSTQSPPEGDLGGLNAKTLLTGTRSYILNSGKFLTTAFYYDQKAQVVQTRATNHLDGFDIVYNKYNFTGTIAQTLKEHSVQVGSTQSPPSGNLGGLGVELYTHTYDHAQRLLSTTYTLNNNTPVVIAENTYDDLGRLIEKKRHSNADTETFEYNIKNWLTKIQSENFVENISYEGLYNGNIKSISTPNLDYTYQYDDLNRLTEGRSVQRFNENFSYDRVSTLGRL